MFFYQQQFPLRKYCNQFCALQRLHDSDGNNRLDGLELLAALMHVHEDDEEEEIDEDAEIAKFKASPDDTQEIKDQKRRLSGEFYGK